MADMIKGAEQHKETAELLTAALTDAKAEHPNNWLLEQISVKQLVGITARLDECRVKSIAERSARNG